MYFWILSLCSCCVSFILSLLIGCVVLYIEYFLPVITCYCSVGLGVICICMFDVLVYVLDIDLVHISHILFQMDTLHWSAVCSILII